MSDKSGNNVSRLPGDDELETLLKRSGMPDRAPEAVRQEIYNTTRDAWQQSLAERQSPPRRRWLAVAAVLVIAAAALLILPSIQQTAQIETTFSVARVTGDPEVIHQDADWENITSNQTITAGDRLRTGNQQRIAIAVSPSGSLRIDEESQLEILQNGDIRLERGALYLDTGDGTASISIKTSQGVVRHLGTQYSVRVQQGDVEVLVREGEVAIESARETHRLQAGAGLGISSTGKVQQRAVSSYSEDWLWTQQITPEFKIDGSSALEFLQWVARESGHTLQFEKPAVRRTAADIRLSGSMGSISPLESLEAVIAGTRLDYRVDDGVILIK